MGTAPITATEHYESAAVVASEGVYLVGSFERSENVSKNGGFLHWGETKSKERAVLQVWATCRCIGGGYVPEKAPEEVRRLPPVIDGGVPVL